MIMRLVCIAIAVFLSTFSYAQGLKVGDNAPGLSGVEWIKGKPTVAFEKGQVYIVELGATWCVPCAKAIPELTKIAEKYATDKVNVIGIFVLEQHQEKPGAKNPAYLNIVRQYVSKKGATMDYSVAADLPDRTIEKNWLRASGKTGVPTTFIIDRDGKIAFISTNYSLTEPNLRRVLDKNYSIDTLIREQAKVDVLPYERENLLLLNDNGGPDSVFLFRSLLTFYDPRIEQKQGWGGYIRNYHSWPDTLVGEYMGYLKDRIQEIGIPLERLYQMAYSDTLNVDWMTRMMGEFIYPDTVAHPDLKSAYGKYWHKPIVEVEDRSVFEWSFTSSANRFNYSLKVPKGMGTAKFLQEIMQRDLQSYFGYKVSVETRSMPCWKISAVPQAKERLKATAPDPHLKATETADGYVVENADMRDIISLFETNFGKFAGNKDPLPFIDATGINWNFGYSISKKEIQNIVQEKNFDAATAFIKKLGLEMTKTEVPMKVVVIRD